MTLAEAIAAAKEYIGPDILAMLGKPSVRTTHCCMCGSYATDNHHEPAKSRVTNKALRAFIPTFKLCGAGSASGCHRLMQIHRVKPAWSVRARRWSFRATDAETAREISARRKVNGLSKVRAGRAFPALEEEG